MGFVSTEFESLSFGGFTTLAESDLGEFSLGGQIERKIALFLEVELGGDQTGRERFHQGVEASHIAVVAMASALNICFYLGQALLQFEKIDTGLQVRVCLRHGKQAAQRVGDLTLTLNPVIH